MESEEKDNCTNFMLGKHPNHKLSMSKRRVCTADGLPGRRSDANDVI